MEVVTVVADLKLLMFMCRIFIFYQINLIEYAAIEPGCLCLCVSAYVSVCVCMSVCMCFIFTAQTHCTVLMRLSTNDLTNIFKVHFLLILKSMM